MKRLNSNDLQRIGSYLNEHGRSLEVQLFKKLLGEEDSQILEELLLYQNEDGGFGKSLEPDIRAPYSTAVTTEFALNLLSDITIPDIHMSKILNYLHQTYDVKNKLWPIVTPEVDLFPRAIWWNYKDISSFGRFNPSATLVSFVYQHDPQATWIDLESHIQEIITYIQSTPLEGFEAHDLLCFNRFYKRMPKHIQLKIEKPLNAAIAFIIEKDPTKWSDYVPEPIKYIDSMNHPLYHQFEDLIHQNLDFIVESKNKSGVWDVKHQWYQYNDVFESIAKKEWSSIITYEQVKTLVTFNRIDI